MSAVHHVKALVLAAGFGTRLKPLTERWPKALIPFFGTPLLDFVLNQVQAANIKDIAVNGHYHLDQLSNFLKTAGWDDVLLAKELPDIMGTGGAMVALSDWIDDSHLLIHNSDVIANMDLRQLIDRHLESDNIATMCLLPTCPPGKNPVYCRKDRIVAIGRDSDVNFDNATMHTLACAHIVSPKFREFLPKKIGFFDVIDAYKLALKAAKPVGAFIHSGFWFDVGTPHDYFSAHRYVLDANDPAGLLKALHHDERAVLKISNQLYFSSRPKPGNFGSSAKTLPPDSCQGVINMSDHPITQESRWRNVIALPGARLPREKDLTNVIIYENRLVYAGD